MTPIAEHTCHFSSLPPSAASFFRTCSCCVAQVRPAFAPWEISGWKRMEALAPPVLSFAENVPASCQARRTMMGMQGLARNRSMRRPRAWTSALEGMVVSGVACRWCRKDNVRTVETTLDRPERETQIFCCTLASTPPALSIPFFQKSSTTRRMRMLGWSLPRQHDRTQGHEKWYPKTPMLSIVL